MSYLFASLFETPWAEALQAPLSRNYPGTNTGLPFPPTGDPLHPGIKPTSLRPPTLAGRFFFLPLLVTWTQYILAESESHSIVSDSLQPRGLHSPCNSPSQNTGGTPFPFPGDLPDTGIEPRYPALQADSLTAEPPRKPKNTGVGSLSLLQGGSPGPRNPSFYLAKILLVCLKCKKCRRDHIKWTKVPLKIS